MGVAEPLRRPTASRGRKRPRAAARLVGTIRAACRRSRLRVNPFLFWLLFSGVWETLIFGTGDWFAFGEPFFCGLFTPTYPLPGHRLVPESHREHFNSSQHCTYICGFGFGSFGDSSTRFLESANMRYQEKPSGPIAELPGLLVFHGGFGTLWAHLLAELPGFTCPNPTF